MTKITQDAVLQKLGSVHLESGGKDLVSLEMVKNVTLERGKVQLTLEMPSPAHPGTEELVSRLRREIQSLDGTTAIGVETTWRVREGESNKPRIPGVKNVLAVASGKGGVGKSTVASNLAVGLSRLGAAVGLLDLDIYGPSVPVSMGNSMQPGVQDGERLVPVEAHGVKLLSMGQLLAKDHPVIWRGPMLHKMVTQFVGADWEPLDYLVLDLPPGTGDVQLTVTQGVPVTGAVIVTTPQEIALIDARKGLQMFRDNHIPILGIVENMAWYSCRKCGRDHAIFGSDGGRELAEKEGVPLLARLPVDPSVVESGDSGRPAVLESSPIGDAFREMAIASAAAAGALSLRKNPFRVLS
jgi:ATP-binding protein involved in chromosome partitioning